MGSPFVRGIAGAIMALAATGVWAQDSSENQVAVKTAWSVFEDNDPKECWAVSAPKETVNTKDGRVVAVRRSDILLMAFYRPGAGVSGQITFTGGYPFAPGIPVTLEVDDEKYSLTSEGEWAWSESSDADAKIIAAMKRGKDAVLTARSARGTQTKDRFSLLGFTAALDEAAKRCK
ncbi:invasion associated locus B family protein [Thalassovita sp.]|jgi:hypothetical protein|uniref:invasion associated locus B family protein n=1 Tax=Thalassovita sp. TaxID=1979401 RepID=UPI003B5CAF81